MIDRERLTELIGEARASFCLTGDYEGYIADYLIKNGVIVLPCKMGDTMYRIKGWYPREVDSFVVPDVEWVVSNMHDFGRLFFFTREEAESALDRPISW